MRWTCSPAEGPEPGQLVGMVHSVADGDDFLEALDLDGHDLQQTARAEMRRENRESVHQHSLQNKYMKALRVTTSIRVTGPM